VKLVLQRPEGTVEIEEQPGARRFVTARPHGNAPISCPTTYPVDLIEAIVDVKGVAWVCDEITRDQDPESIQRFFEHDFLPYVSAAEFEGKRVLDFGCGSGASTMVLARMFPRSSIVGIELSPEYLDLARSRLRFHGYTNVEFCLSPSGTSLPADLGPFDFIVMSAVFEHLLPDERRTIMPRLWAHLAPGGRLLLNQTPHRFFPFESHTTGLPFINYLPDRVAHFVSRHFSARSLERESWEGLLRKGIRGATEREVLASLGPSTNGARAALVAPRQPNRDRVDVWYAALGPRHRTLKALCRGMLRLVERGVGTTLVVNLALAIAKDAGAPRRGRA
jgi:2-polyprenyl-3-methyl-5-hydroxy-6-metoxy-1,4-benzoquinol methylase